MIGESDDAMTLLIDPEDSTKWVQIAKADIAAQAVCPPR